jgi:DNA mismatch endonuclease (patch repair protein)
MDVMTAEQRSRCMAKIRGTNTGPEIRLRKALWRAGRRYTLHPHLPGRPDLMFVSARVAVFVDGCFCHRCPKHATRPKTNARFWKLRLDGNVRRDRRVDIELRQLGLKVLRFWEHEVKDSLPAVLARVEKTLEQRTLSHSRLRRRTIRRRA